MNAAFIRLGSDAAPSWLGRMDGISERVPGGGLPFEPAEYERRVAAVRSDLPDGAAIVVFRPSSIEYLTGYHSVETLPQPLVITQDHLALCVPDAEVGRAVVSARLGEILHYRAVRDGLELCAQWLSTVLVPGARVLVDHGQHGAPTRFVGLLEASGLTVGDAQQLVERHRLVLSPAEIAAIRVAAQRTARAESAALEAAAVEGATDASVAAALLGSLATGSNSLAAFGPVVATGARGSLPHSTFAGVPLANGAPTFLEFAGTEHRYHAPVMRTLHRGSTLPADVRMLEELAVTHVSAVTDVLRPGRTCHDVAHAAKAALGELREDVIFHFNFGYPVGLAHPPSWIDGAPFFLMEGNHGVIERDMVFHLPASFRIPGLGGVGLSQTVRVTADGCETLTEGGRAVTVLG